MWEITKRCCGRKRKRENEENIKIQEEELKPILEKKKQLWIVINVIFQTLSEREQSLVRGMIKSCGETNKNEIIKQACSLIIEEREQEELEKDPIKQLESLLRE